MMLNNDEHSIGTRYVYKYNTCRSPVITKILFLNNSSVQFTLW